MTSCQDGFELGFSFFLAIAKIADGLSQDIQVQDLGWKSTPVCSLLRFFVLRSSTAGQWNLFIMRVEGKKKIFTD